MKEIFQRLKIPIIIIAVLFAGLLFYNLFLKKPASPALLKTADQGGAPAPESNFLPILLEVQAVTLDEKLFFDPIFRALVDFSQPIIPESQGKANRFSGASCASPNAVIELLGFTDETAPSSASTSGKK